MVDPSIRLAKNVLASDKLHFLSYLPSDLDGIAGCLWTRLIEKRFQLAYKDVVAAFRYYWNIYNQGRPFILAGHSQGGKSRDRIIETRDNTGDLPALSRILRHRVHNHARGTRRLSLSTNG